MGCCKSNSAINTHKEPPKVDSSSKEAPPEQAPQAASTDYAKFLDPQEDDLGIDSTRANPSTEVTQSKSEESENPTMQDSTDEIEDMLKDLPSIQSKEYQVQPNIIPAASSDDITELYVEPPKVPKNAYVYLPDVKQRGYEPWGSVSYGPKDESWKKSKPFRIGTLVWYRNTTDPGAKWRKFKWYIPGVIEKYVWSNRDKNEVIGYKISIESRAVPRMDEYFLDLLKNANPAEVALRWDEKTPPCPVKGIDNSALAGDSNERFDGVVAELGEDLGFQGAKQSGLGPHMWGITLEQLQDVKRDPEYDESMSMYDVIKTIIKPKTAGTGLGYALLLNEDEPLRAKFMVSHAWGENYNQFLSALRESNCAGPFWVCAMSICQNNDHEEVTIEKQLGPDPKYGPFATVLKQADSMIAIMTQSCDIYTRLWCVYEIYVAISLGIPVSLHSYKEITGYGGSDKMYSNVVLDSSGTPVESINASCGYEEDTNMITEEISKLEGGFDLIDDVVMWVRIKALINEMDYCKKMMWTESQMPVPIGTCSASNIASRQNAGIANALRVWHEAKIARKGEVNKEKDDDDDDEILTPFGYFSALIRDKCCNGSPYF